MGCTASTPRCGWRHSACGEAPHYAHGKSPAPPPHQRGPLRPCCKRGVLPTASFTSVLSASTRGSDSAQPVAAAAHASRCHKVADHCGGAEHSSALACVSSAASLPCINESPCSLGATSQHVDSTPESGSCRSTSSTVAPLPTAPLRVKAATPPRRFRLAKLLLGMLPLQRRASTCSMTSLGSFSSLLPRSGTNDELDGDSDTEDDSVCEGSFSGSRDGEGRRHDSPGDVGDESVVDAALAQVAFDVSPHPLLGTLSAGTSELALASASAAADHRTAGTGIDDAHGAAAAAGVKRPASLADIKQFLAGCVTPTHAAPAGNSGYDSPSATPACKQPQATPPSPATLSAVHSAPVLVRPKLSAADLRATLRCGGAGLAAGASGSGAAGASSPASTSGCLSPALRRPRSEPGNTTRGCGSASSAASTSALVYRPVHPGHFFAVSDMSAINAARAAVYSNNPGACAARHAARAAKRRKRASRKRGRGLARPRASAAVTSTQRRRPQPAKASERSATLRELQGWAKGHRARRAVVAKRYVRRTAHAEPRVTSPLATHGLALAPTSKQTAGAGAGAVGDNK